uniref:Copper-transporting ATPase RAN1 n=1 Tax=Lygus hesperus TaxID=30085 RepID=A0A0A9W6G2_LYGHE
MAVMLFMSFSHYLSDHLPINQLVDCIQLMTSSPIVFYFGRHFFDSAWCSLRHGAFTMDTLVALGIGCSYVYSTLALLASIVTQTHKMTYFDTAGMLTTFMLLGRLLEANAKKRTSGALIELMSLVPPYAYVLLESNSDEEG